MTHRIFTTIKTKTMNKILLGLTLLLTLGIAQARELTEHRRGRKHHLGCRQGAHPGRAQPGSSHRVQHQGSGQ